MTDSRRIPAQPGSQRAVSRRPDRQACRAGDDISYLGYGQAVGVDVLGEFGCTKPLEMVAQVLDRPAPAPGLSSQTAPAQPPPHGRRLTQQGEVVHRETIPPQGADYRPEVAGGSQRYRDDVRAVVAGQCQAEQFHEAMP